MDLLIRNWNWKAALLSSAMRSVLFLGATLPSGWRVAMSAMVLEFAFRPTVSGVLGATTQAFRSAEPVWQANLTVMALLPAVSHALEYLVHHWHGTPNLNRSMLLSVAFSSLASVMNLAAMRRGILVVNVPDAASLTQDLRRIPGMLFRRGRT